MGVEKAKLKKAAGRRRDRAVFPAVGMLSYPAKEGGKRWGGVIAGAFLFALTAFVSGVWVGKTINGLPPNQGLSSSNKPEKQQKDPPPKFEQKKQEDPAKKVTKPFTSEVADNREEKSQTAQTKPGKEKTAALTEETPSQQGAKSGPVKGRFTLQVGAFNNAEEAQQLVNQLKGKGYAAYQITGNAAAKGMWYRVRVGHFPSLQDARQFALLFEKKEKNKPIITTVPSP